MAQNTEKLIVNWGDTDMAGIVYYPNYFRWFDISTLRLLQKVGLPPRELMTHQKMSFPLIDSGCTCFKPLYFNDEIRVETKIIEVNNKTFKLEHEVYRGDELTGKGYEVRGWVTFSEEKIKSVPIPDDVRRKLTQVRIEV